MAKVIANELERFRRDIKEAQQKIQELQDTYNTMFDEITALTGMWEGEARTTFHNAFVQDANQMVAFYNAVSKYVETLINTASKYQEAELRNVEIGKTRSY